MCLPFSFYPALLSCCVHSIHLYFWLVFILKQNASLIKHHRVVEYFAALSWFFHIFLYQSRYMCWGAYSNFCHILFDVRSDYTFFDVRWFWLPVYCISHRHYLLLRSRFSTLRLHSRVWKLCEKNRNNIIRYLYAILSISLSMPTRSTKINWNATIMCIVQTIEDDSVLIASTKRRNVNTQILDP